MRERNRWLGSRKRNLLLTVLFPIFKDFLNNLDHMKYEVERAADKTGEPSIAEMTENAIQILQKNLKGFFLLVEGWITR